MYNRIAPFAAFTVSLLTFGFGPFRPLASSSPPSPSTAHEVNPWPPSTALVLPNTVINIKGACAGPVAITTNGLQLNGIGSASITGGGKNAVTITGAQRVGLTGLSITGGANGLVAQNGAQVLLQNVTVSGNAQTGISALANSSVTVTGGSSQNNGLFGIDVEATSALVVTGSYSITGERSLRRRRQQRFEHHSDRGQSHRLAEHARHSAGHQCFGFPRWSFNLDCQPELQRWNHDRLWLTHG